MKAKAIHRGHCQVCNRVQKLPDGKLAKHGYQVLGGYFAGTCFGSNELPLEVDKKIVVKSIEWAKERRIGFEDLIPIWSAPATEPEGWFNEYVSNRYISGYHWNRVKLFREQRATGTYTFNEDYFINYRGEREPLRRHSISGNTLLDIANELNKRYVDQFLRKAVVDMTRYIHDQQHRIKAWHEQPLLPLED